MENLNNRPHLGTKTRRIKFQWIDSGGFGQMSAARFRSPDKFGGWAPLGLSVSGRIDLNDDSE